MRPLTAHQHRARALQREGEVLPWEIRRGRRARVARRENRVVFERLRNEEPRHHARQGRQYALLAHEAVHVAQRYFEDIGEEDPSEELRAYAVQAVTQHLVYEHTEWLKKRKKY